MLAASLLSLLVGGALFVSPNFVATAYGASGEVTCTATCGNGSCTGYQTYCICSCTWFSSSAVCNCTNKPAEVRPGGGGGETMTPGTSTGTTQP